MEWVNQVWRMRNIYIQITGDKWIATGVKSVAMKCVKDLQNLGNVQNKCVEI